MLVPLSFSAYQIVSGQNLALSRAPFFTYTHMNTSHLGRLWLKECRLMLKANFLRLTLAIHSVNESILGGVPTDSM